MHTEKKNGKNVIYVICVFFVPMFKELDKAADCLWTCYFVTDSDTFERANSSYFSLFPTIIVDNNTKISTLLLEKIQSCIQNNFYVGCLEMISVVKRNNRNKVLSPPFLLT